MPWVDVPPAEAGSGCVSASMRRVVPAGAPLALASTITTLVA
jgi:hypothetical protein